MKNTTSYIWSFAGRFGSQVTFLITNIVLARILTPDDFGTIGVISIFISVSNTISDSGMGGALMMEKDLNKKNCGTIFCFNIAISVFLFLLLFLCAPLVEDFYNIEDLSIVTRLVSFCIIINAIGLVPKNILLYKLKFKQISAVTIVSVCLAALISIGLAINRAGVYSLVAYQLLHTFFMTIGYVLMAKYRFPISFDMLSFKRMFGFGLYTTITCVVDSFYENLLTSIFGKVFNVTQTGYLAQAKKLEEASSSSIMVTINNTAYPILSKIRNDIDAFKKETQSLQEIIPNVITPALIILGVYSKEIILLLYGKEWEYAAPYLSLLVVAGFFMIIESINRNFIKSLGDVKELFFYTLLKRITGCLFIFISIFLSPHLILYAYVLSAFWGYIVNSYLYCNLTKQSFFLSIWRQLVSIAPVCVLASLVWGLYTFSKSLSFSIIINTIIIAIYYLIELPRLGISIKSKMFQ